MIPELGHFALILALFVATAQAHPLLSRQAAFLQFGLCLIAFLALMYSYVTSDFTVVNVAANSHTLKPLVYKIAGVWGNHEGSMLLWLLMLSLFGALVALKPPLPAGERDGVRGTNNAESGDIPLTLTLSPRGEGIKVLQIMGLLSLGFIAYTLFASSPFERIDPPPFDGMDLNPVLQDPSLAIHPPLLYMGYVGFSVAFAFAVSALWNGTMDKDWAASVRPWIMLAWTALSCGIALGSFWAYYELGWGGWWFWDPVENASLMPWLAGTALLHSVIVLEKREALKRWTVLLCIFTFSLSMLGTFLVRSGVLTSVHAFAVDPMRGIFILILLSLYTGGALVLYAWRASRLEGIAAFSPVSRESALILNNLFLTTMAATVLIGTLYPLILATLDAGQISVGPPFFHATFVPLAVPLVFLMAIGPFIPWKKVEIATLAGRLKIVAGTAMGIAILAAIMARSHMFFSALGMGLGSWLALGTLWEARQRFTRLVPLRQWGMSAAHLGLGVAIFGMAASGLWVKESAEMLRPGQKMSVGYYELTLENVTPAFGPNYSALRADIEARDTRGGESFSLAPEKRFYPVAEKNTSEAAIRTMPGGDLYVTLGDRDGEAWVVNAKTHPLIGLLWLGFAFIALGGGMALAGGRKP